MVTLNAGRVSPANENELLTETRARSRLTFLIPFTVSTTSSVSPENAIGATRYPNSSVS